MKKFLMFSLIGSIIFSILGCNVLAKTTELIVWAPTPSYQELQVAWSRAFQSFEKSNPGTKIVFQTFPFEQVATKFITAHLSGQTPDVVMLNNAVIASSIQKKALLSLSGLLGKKYLSEFVPAALETATYRGKVYGLPLKVNLRLMVYNKRMFAKAGIDRLPENLSEFTEVTKRLTIDKDGDGKIDQFGTSFGLKLTDVMLSAAPFIYGNGGSILNADYTKSTLNQPEAIEALQFVCDLMLVHKVMPPGEIERNKNDVRPLFMAEKIAIYQGGLYDIGIFAEQAPNLDYGMMIFPGGKLRSGNIITGWDLVVPSKSSNPKKALELIKWLLDPANIDLIDSLPGRKEAYDLPLYNTPLYLVGKEQLLYSKAYPVIPQWPEIMDIFGVYVQRALLGQLTPKEAMTKAAEDINRVLAK